MNKLILLWFLWSLPVLAQTNVLYQNDFTQAELGKVPDDFKVLAGEFVVKEQPGNRFLELPGAPLDAFMVLFGPVTSSNVTVTARIHGEAKGRRFPTFGVGVNGVAGYRLQITPARNAIELFKDRELKASAPFHWKTGDWSMLRLQLRSAKPKGWKLEGKVWAAGASEPGQWMISFQEEEEPPPGHCSLFGSPFAGTPIRFDDLVVTRAEARD